MAAKVNGGDFTMVIDEQSRQWLYSRMTKLADFEKDAAIKRGLKAGAQLIVSQGKSNFIKSHKSRTGKLIKSAGVTVAKRDPKVWGAFRRPAGSAAHLLDRGTEDRYNYTYKGKRLRKPRYVGRVKPSYFWTNAYNEKKAEAGDKIINIIDKTVQSILEY